MRVLDISGSLRRDSHNAALLRAAGELVEEEGAEFEVFDGLKAIPPYDEDDNFGSGPPAVAHLRRAIAGADALLFATPEYNSSIPGQLKNALDWASRPFPGNALRGKDLRQWRARSAMIFQQFNLLPRTTATWRPATVSPLIAAPTMASHGRPVRTAFAGGGNRHGAHAVPPWVATRTG